LITDALIELSIRGDFLKEEADITTKEDIYIYELDFKNKLVVKIDDEHRLKYWDFEKYMLYKTGSDADKTGSDRKGCPSHFSWTGGYVEDGQQSKPFMYLDPIPDDNDGDNYTLHLYYTQIHPRVITVCDYILFHEKYEPLLKMLILARWAETKNLDEDAMKYELKFENMLKNYKTIEGNIRQAKYYDFA